MPDPVLGTREKVIKNYSSGICYWVWDVNNIHINKHVINLR